MNKEVQIIVSARDLADQTFKNMVRNVDNANMHLERLDRGFSTIQDTVTGLSQILAGAGGLAAVVKDATEAASQAGSMSQIFGIAASTIQALGYAAKQEDVNIESLGAGIKKLSVGMFDAATKGGQMNDIFKGLNIAIKENGKLRNSVDVMLDIADIFQSMPDEAERSALAVKLFGKSGTDLVPLLSRGREAIIGMMKDAKDLGFVMSEETIRKFDEFEKSTKAAGDGITGLGRQVAADFLPVMKAATDIVVETIKWYNQLPGPIRTVVSDTVILTGSLIALNGAAKLILPLLPGVVSGANNIAFAFSAWKAGAATAGEAIGFLAAGFTPFLIGGAIFLGIYAIIGLFDQMRLSAKLAHDDISKMTDIGDIEKSINMISARLTNEKQELATDRTALIFIGDRDQVIKDREANIKKLESELKQLETRRDQLLKPMGSSSSPTSQLFEPKNEYASYEIYQEAQTDLLRGQMYQKMLDDKAKADNSYYKQMEKSVLMQKEAVEKAAAEESKTYRDYWDEGLSESMRDFDNWGQHVQDMAAAAAYGMEQGFYEFFDDAMHGRLKSAADYFQSFLDTIVSAWSEAMAQMATQQIMSGAFGDWMGGWSNGGNNGTQSLQTWDQKLGQKASGGPVYAGQSYVVGEKGWEPFIPAQNGRILSNVEAKDALRGGGNMNVQVNVINQTGTQVTAKKTQPQFDGKQYVVGVVIEAVNNNTGGLGDMIKAAAAG